MIDAERAGSLTDRLGNEDLLTEHALKKPVFGWGAWGRWRVKDADGRDITVSDGMWIIVRGEKGLVGLTSVTLVILLPFLLLLMRVPARDWSQPAFAAPAAIATLLVLYSIDNLFNAMLNPLFILGAGGLSGLYVAFPRLQAMARQSQMAAMMQFQRQSQMMQRRAAPAMRHG
jgi:O-antigen ligase